MFIVASARLGNQIAHAAIGHSLNYGLGIEENCASSRIYLISAAKKCIFLLFPKVHFIYFI